MGLRDLPVLAEGAVEVAAPGCDGVGVAAGQEVVEGLLLDRLRQGNCHLAVHERVEPAAAVLPHTADADPARPEDAAMSAGDAADAARGDRIVERLAKQSLANVRLRLCSSPQIPDPETGRGLLAGEAGTHGLGRRCIRVEGNRRRQGECLAAARRASAVVHQGPLSADSP